MATGDTNDMVTRLRAVLPPWFPDPIASPFLQAILTGLGSGLAFAYSFIAFAATQTRIATASGGWLDLIAWDFFGTGFLRRPTETDISFQPRLMKELFRPRVTRAALLQMLVDLTGRQPSIIEPWNTGDVGAWDINTFAYDAYGCYGDTINNLLYIVVFRPSGTGIPLVSGFDSNAGAWDQNLFAYVDQSQITGPVTDAEILQQIRRTVAAGVNPQVVITG